MPKGPREKILSNLDSAIKHTDWVLGYLVENGEINREHHPDITKEYEVAFAFFTQARELLEGFRRTY